MFLADGDVRFWPKQPFEWTSIIVNIPLLAITLFLLWTSLAHGDNYSDCEVTKESQISFSSEDAANRLLRANYYNSKDCRQNSPFATHRSIIRKTRIVSP